MSPSNTTTSKDNGTSSTPAENATPSKSSTTGGAGASTEFEPPLACVRRLLKNSLPSSTNVGKDASSAFARACGIFVIYLTACANDFARENKRQTITANDIMAAIKELDFDEFTPQLSAFLDQHRKEEKAKRERKKTAESRKTSEGSSNKHSRGDVDLDEDQSNGGIESSDPKKKKIKTDNEGNSKPPINPGENDDANAEEEDEDGEDLSVEEEEDERADQEEDENDDESED